MIDVVSAYRFHMFSLAGELHSSGRLGRLYTAMPRRLIPEVPSHAIESRSLRALTSYAFNRLGLPTHGRVHRHVVADFDKWVAARIASAPVVTALSGFATQTLQVASARGSRAVCDRGSTHILAQRRILETEASAWNFSPPFFDPWTIDRELREYELVDAIMVPSHFVHRSFVENGVDPRKVHIVPYGIDTDTYRPAHHTETEAGRIICVGTVDYRKGHQYLVPAFRKIQGRGTHLELVGGIPDPAFTAALGVPDDNITLTGTVSRPEVARRLHRAAIFALVSVEEGFSLAVLQAMACSVPVVVSTSTGADDLVEHGVDGMIVPTGDVDALADALQQLLDDPARASAMGAAARSKALATATLEAYGKRALDVFEGLLD